MRVLVLPADTGGCGFYRLIFAAQHLRLMGHDVHISYPDTKNNGFNVLFHDEKMVDFELPLEGVDVLVMQRVTHDWHRQAIPLIRAKGIAVVIDMDDDLSTIHPMNQAFQMYRQRTSTPFSHKTGDQTCRDATYVTVSTSSLMKVYVKHGRGQTLDNYVPERYLDISPLKEGAPVFGWAGTIQSHPTDLKVMGDSVQKAISAGHKFKIIGPMSPGVAQQLKLKEDPPASGGVTTPEWAEAVATLDVGVAPLEMSQFNRSKSRLKVLEYNSTGVPYIASPRDEYRKYHKDSGGVGGLLVETPKQWLEAVTSLMTNDQLRKELAGQGRAFAATQTIERNSWRFLEAWAEAYKIQQSMPKTWSQP